MKANFFTILIKRFASERPAFWKTLSTWGLVLTAAIAGVLGLVEYEIISLPDNWYRLLSHLSTFFAGIFVAGSAATTNADLLDEETIKNAKTSEKIR